MMNREETLKILEKSGVLLKGHFLLTSGRHSGQYLQCAKLFQYPEYAEIITRELVKQFENTEIDLIASPAIGGIILGYEVARQLNVRNIFIERENGRMALRRGFKINKGERVLVVEDVVTTGGSVKEVIDVIKENEGEVVGVGCIVDRSNGKYSFDEKLISVIKFNIETYEAENCPLCKQDIPVVKPGSRNFQK
jgi:orotate phosphoribosyltransferase